MPVRHCKGITELASQFGHDTQTATSADTNYECVHVFTLYTRYTTIEI